MFFSAVVEKWMDRSLIDVSPLYGGDINQVFRLHFRDSDCVLKLNDSDRYPDMFEREAAGLALIGTTGCRTPRVLKTFKEGRHQFLILEFIEQETPDAGYWERFGKRLAGLHAKTSSAFGIDADNFIGSLRQSNSLRETWTDFFIDCRILPLMQMGRDKNLLSAEHVKRFERLFSRLTELIPEEKASLLHGDLWSGNLMCGSGGEPVFIDPAVYFGHREMDIAMTRMFGGFDESFINSYNEIQPLESGWSQRIEIHNLYPNLVHLLLFGSSYLKGIEKTLKVFS